jgi:catalase
MRKIIIYIGVLLSFGISASAAEQQVSFGSEFAEIRRLYEEMTPEQRAEVLAQAKKIQAEIAAMPIAERQRLYSDAAAAVKTIDFDKVDVSKIDTSKQVSLSQVDEMMNNQKKGNIKANVTAKNPSKPIVD